MNKLSLSKVMERIMFIFGVDNDSQLSRAANINRQTIASWRRRDSIPYAECISIAVEKGLSLNWLLMGEGEVYRSSESATVTYCSKTLQTLQTSENKMVQYQAEFSLSLKERQLLHSFKDLSDEDQASIQMILEEKKRLSLMEQQLKKLSLELNRIKK